MPLVVDALDHLVVNVRDVEVAAAWYHKVLGMTRESVDTPHGKVTAMKFGRQKINLRPITATKAAWYTADHEAAGGDNLCFLTQRHASGSRRSPAGPGRAGHRRPDRQKIN